MSQGKVYLIHFNKKIGNLINPRSQAQHYIGWSRRFQERMYDHANGRGSAIMNFLSEQKIGWTVARVWDGGRKLERQLKQRHRASDFCPICQKKK